MRYLKLIDILTLSRKIPETSGGYCVVRDMNALESALAQPYITFGGADLYPTLAEKAAALGFSLIANHPFVDGNKRIGHAAMEVFLFLNGYEIAASVDEQEQVILAVASGTFDRASLMAWLASHIVQLF